MYITSVLYINAEVSYVDYGGRDLSSKFLVSLKSIVCLDRGKTCFVPRLHSRAVNTTFMKVFLLLTFCELEI